MLTAVDRFWMKVQITESCWLWTAATQNGYGVFSLNCKNVKAHRFSYELHCGLIADGLTIDHLCRVRRCVNPLHLEPVTMTENNRRSTGFRTTRDKCLKNHPYAEHGRLQGGYYVCRVCDTERHRNRRKAAA